MKSLEFSLKLLRQIRNHRLLSVAEIECLLAMANGCKTNSDLSNYLGVSKAVIAHRIKILRDKFMVISNYDKPRKHSLTEEGRYNIRTIFSFLKDV